MNRPLLITDCDEVLLHMVKPFRDWLAEFHGIDFHWNGNDFARSVHYISTAFSKPRWIGSTRLPEPWRRLARSGARRMWWC